jgi:glycosyltransferase involved in cell wall biosynthesis
VGSVSDIVSQGVNGLLTETTSDGLIIAAKSLLDSTSMRDEFGKAGQKRAHQYFTSEAMVKHHERLYSRII